LVNSVLSKITALLNIDQTAILDLQYLFIIMRHPITFPVSAEIVGSGLLITLNSGEIEFHPSDPVPTTPRAKVLNSPWKRKVVSVDGWGQR